MQEKESEGKRAGPAPTPRHAGFDLDQGGSKATAHLSRLEPEPTSSVCWFMYEDLRTDHRSFLVGEGAVKNVGGTDKEKET